MKYFFSAPGNASDLLKREGAENFLCSYVASPKEYKHFLGTHKSVIIDSGAFSAWNSGKSVDIEKYIAYCQNLDQDWTFINLDVIPKTGSSSQEIERCIEQSKENFLYIKTKIKNVLPVYHYGEDLSVLKWYMDHCDYIGISPANDTHEKVKRAFLDSVFNITRDRIKCHGLGYSSFSGLLRYPFYSVDSISFKRYIVKDKISVQYAKNLEWFIAKSIRKFINQEKLVTRVWKERGVEWK